MTDLRVTDLFVTDLDSSSDGRGCPSLHRSIASLLRWCV